jgi:bifunctional non-homologous end joining protein LigD
MPVIWPAVTPELDPSVYTIRTVPKLLERSKAWAEYESGRRRLHDAIVVLSENATKIKI